MNALPVLILRFISHNTMRLRLALVMLPVATRFVRKKAIYRVPLFLILAMASTSFANTANTNLFSQPLTICSGASIVIKGDAKAPIPNSYSWEVSQGTSTWSSAPGIINSADYTPSLLVNNTNADIVYSIRRKTVTAGVTAYDSFYDITVLSALPITGNTITAPAVAGFCASGTPAAITGSAPTGNTGVFTYQWQSSTDNITFSDIAGATAINYTPAVLNATTYYRRTVNAASCVGASVSNTVTMTVIAAVSNNVITPPVVNSFCATSDPLTITGNTPTGGSGAFSYQWQTSTDHVTFTDISGATAKDYDPPVILATTYYRRTVISGACATPVNSNVVTLSILPAITNNTITAPAITTFCVSGDPAIIMGNVPTGGNNTYNYQWQRSADNVTFTDIAGATAKDYDPATINTPTYYRRTATSGQCTIPIVSNVVTISLMAFPAVPVVAQPSVTVCPGSAATLAINTPQPGFTYNWYDTATKTNLLFTGTSFTTAPVSANTTFYVESSNGVCSSTTLTAVQVNMTVPPATPSLVNTVANICNGATAAFTVSNAQPGYTYSWYANPTGGTALATGVNFTTPALTANTTYYVEAQNASGCNSPSRTAATAAVAPLLQFTATGADICPGSTASVTATTSLSNIAFNWYANASGGSPLFTGATFTTPVLNANTAYYAEATNTLTGCVSASRQVAQVQISQPLPAPVVAVNTTTSNSVTFEWPAINGATAYQVSTNNGSTYTDPSSGSSGLLHTVSGVLVNQPVTIIVRALGATVCQMSSNSAPVTAKATSLTDDIFVPNAFTPNGDGKNDVVRVHSEGIVSLSFGVYDQWGECLFNTTDINAGWDGTFKGKREPYGVYIYYLKALMNNGHQVNRKGTLTLLR